MKGEQVLIKHKTLKMMLRARSLHQIWEGGKWRGKKRKLRGSKKAAGRTRMEIKEWDVGNQWEKFEPWPESIKQMFYGNSIPRHRFSFNKV